MMKYYTSAAQHLARSVTGAYEIGRFADGEIRVKIHDEVQDKSVWVIASTIPPADNFFELFLMLSALQEAGATINLIVTYLGYVRQDKPKYGEPASLKVVGAFLQQFNLNKLFVIHPHSELVHDVITCTAVIPSVLFISVMRTYDVMIIPDAGARRWAEKIADEAGKPWAFFEKKRLESGEVEIGQLQGDVAGKRCLMVDDMIATGGTLVKESSKVLESGAREVAAIATHGIFAGDALQKIAGSSLSTVFVTNSTGKKVAHDKIQVLDIEPMLARIMHNGE